MDKSNTLVRVVAGCLIKQDDRYLFVQEAKAKAYGLWDLPAGHVFEGDSLEMTAIREVKEETGYDVDLKEHLNLFHDALDKPVIHIYRAEIIGGELRFDNKEILNAKWLTYSEIKGLHDAKKLRAEWIWALIQIENSEI